MFDLVFVVVMDAVRLIELFYGFFYFVSGVADGFVRLFDSGSLCFDGV